MKDAKEMELTEKTPKKKKKGFTLIELLAVIIILGILMIIAIPSVTSYISDSRKNAYVDTAKEIVSGTRNIVNDGNLGMYDTGATYYIPAKYVKTEGALKSPYGEFTETSAYVGVIYDGKGYKYYWISVDDAGMGVKNVVSNDVLDVKDIESDLKIDEIYNTVTTTSIEDRTKILILNLDGTWQEARESSQNFNEDGELEPRDTLLAIFVTGEEFNSKTKKLAGHSTADYNTADTNIIYFKRSKVEPSNENKQSQNIISSSDSEVPIYAWFDNGTLYWWSEDIKPNLNSSSRRMFTNFQGLKEIELKNIKTNLSTDMSSMFGNCGNLETIDVSKFDTRNVTNMMNMFLIQSGVEPNLKQIKGLENFNTSKVTTMKHMFSGQRKIKSLNVKNFNTSNVTDMRCMFQSMESLESLDVSKFDTSKVTDMGYMFNKVSKLKKLNVKNFNTSNVTDMKAMFQFFGSLEELDLSSFNTNKVTNMSYMFRNATIKHINLKSFNTSNVTNMTAMFYGIEPIEQLDVSSFNTSKVTDMAWMFGCGEVNLHCKLSNIIGLDKFNTSNVTTMQAMFSNQQNLRTLDLSSFNTSKLKTSSYMFAVTNLITIYASSSFNVSGVTTSTNMFAKSSEGMTASSSYVLTGGAGTTYSSSHVDKEYARIDDPANGNPGYFTLKTS